MFSKRMGYLVVFAAFVTSVASCATKKTALERGVQSYEAQDYETATQHFETALDTESENAQALHYLGRIALDAGDVDEAIERLEKAVALEDATSDYHFWLGVAYGQKIQKVSFFEKGQLAPKLKSEFEKAVEMDPTNIRARMGLTQYYINAPPMVGGSMDKAMEQIEAIKELDPRQGYLFLAQLLTGKKEYDAAETELEAALALDPDDTDIHYQMGMLYQTKEDYGAAFEAFEEAIQIDPKHMNATYQIGRTAVLSGKNLDRGVTCLKIYLETDPGPGQPTWANAHWRLGMLYEKMGQTEMAREEYETALESDPDNKEVKEALERLPQ